MGPNDFDSALVMGNSTAIWKSCYWLSRDRVQTDRAVGAMTEWRQQMLAVDVQE